MTTVQAAPSFVSQDLLNTVNAKKTAVADDSVQADQDKFMTLLITQMKNQDPMNPLDNAQITSQLAALSTVTGVNKLNTTLESLKSSYQSSEALQATNMIGHGVLVPGGKVQLVDGKAIMGVEVDSPADQVDLIITDPSTGKDVQTISLGAQQPGVVPIAWDGVPDPTQVDAAGKPVTLKNGEYLIRVVAHRGEDVLKDATSLSFDSVASVTTNGKDGVKLNLASQGSVALTDIKQIL